MTTGRPILAEYVRAGWALTWLQPTQKQPTHEGWNTIAKAVRDPDVAQHLDGNVGLLHAYSGTCCVDVDSIQLARPWLAERGIDLDGLLAALDAVKISSGREDRAKLLYRCDIPLPSFKLSKAGIELRCGTRKATSVQDALPPSIHPITGNPYCWEYNSDEGHWSNLPEMPTALRALWEGMIDKDTKIKEDETPQLPVGLAALRTMLYRHDPDVTYDEWVKIGMALHHETGGDLSGFSLWDEWSKRGKKYNGKEDLESHWRSFGATSSPVTGASLRIDEPAHAEEFPEVTEEQVAAAIAASAKPIPPAVRTIVAETAERAVVAADEAEAIREKLRALKRDDTGKALPVLPNLMLVLADDAISGTQLSYDEFKGAIMCAERGSQNWRPFRDTDYTALRLWLENTANFRPVAKDLVRDTVLYLSEENTMDSAQTWLTSLQWDGTPRVERFFPGYMGTIDAQYERDVGLYLWTALAGRVMQPGCQADMVPVLIGAQGIGKTQGIKALVPDPEFYVELRLDDDDEKSARKMRGALIGELNELRGLHTAEYEKILAFITRTHEKWTPKYMEFSTTYARRLVLIGSTNEDEFLVPGENRRWLPMRVSQVDVDAIRADREQLWAEAFTLWKADGVRWRGAQALGKEQHNEFAMGDNWQQLVEDWLRENGGPVRMADVLSLAIGLDVRHTTRNHELRCGRIMRQLGYEKKVTRIKGRVTKAWVPPASNVDPLS